ncbi:MAG: hypothetical protein AMXMBFR7_06110 [Planctomycetota bacterium]
MLFEPQRTAYDLRFTLLRIPTRVHPFFWLGAVFMGWHEGAKLSSILIWVACVFVSILLHEFGHALTARYFGARGTRVWLYTLGGLAISEGGLTRRQRIIELLMGPGAGFILFGLIYGAGKLKLYDPFTLHPYASEALWHLEHINLWWGLVNLIPVYPLDGGQIMREIVLGRQGERGNALAFGISMAAALLAILGFAAWAIVQQEPLKTIWWPVLLFAILAYYSWKLRQMAVQGYGFGGEEPRQAWERDPDWWKQGR